MTIYIWQQQYQKLQVNIYKPAIVYKRIIADHSGRSQQQLRLVPHHSSSFKNSQQQYIWQQKRIKALQVDHSSWALINTYIFAVVPKDHSNWPVPSLASSCGPQRTHMCGTDLATGTTNLGNTWLIIELTKRLHNWKWSTYYLLEFWMHGSTSIFSALSSAWVSNCQKPYTYMSCYQIFFDFN